MQGINVYMKKKIIFILILIFGISILGCKKNLVEGYVTENYINHDFLCKNPLFYQYIFPNLEAVKGKIIRISKEEYLYDEHKQKSYSDSYDRYVSYEYLFFNDNGTIDTKFYICLFDDGSYSMAKKTDYFYEKNQIKVKTIKYPASWNKNEEIAEEIINYIINNDDENYLVYLSDKDASNNYEEIRFNKNQIITMRYSNKQLKMKTVRGYDSEKTAVYNYYNEKLYSYSEYSGVNLIKEEVYDDNLTYYRNFDRKNNVVIDIYEQDNQIIQKEQYTLYDTVSSSGIVSCEKIGSEENEEFGIHTITKYEVLENEDEILKTFFWNKEIKEYWGF